MMDDKREGLNKHEVKMINGCETGMWCKMFLQCMQLRVFYSVFLQIYNCNNAVL